MAPGFDVLQLQRNLAAFGLYGGVLDGRFSPGTVAAVRGWQHRLGLAPTGRLERGSIVFGRGVLRVAGRRAALGAPLTAGAEVVSTSAVGQVVRTDVPLEDRAAVRPGQRARVELPGGRTTTGRVVRVGAPRQRTTDQGTTVVLPTTLHLRNRRAGVPYDGARVTVRIQSRPRPDRLTVPVAALVALGPDAFGVEVPRRSGASRRVPVRVGTFSAGRVEISGAGIRPGLRVVVGAE
jgi:peptidoglycan hydrolase-like protein with peptidoglycan-binding domain